MNGLETQAVSDTSWQVTLAENKIKAFGQGEEVLKIIATDTAGNSTEGTKTISIDTLAPKVAVINKVAVDNIINASESKSGVTITGTKEAGSKVTLNGLATQAVSDTSWKVTLTENKIKAFEQGEEKLKIIATDAAGNITNSNHAITIDTLAPSAATVHKIATDNIIDSTESKAGVTISGSHGKGETVTVNGMATQAVSATEWNLTLTEDQILALGQGEKNLQIATTDAAGNITHSTQTMTVDTLSHLKVSASASDAINKIHLTVSNGSSTLEGG